MDKKECIEQLIALKKDLEKQRQEKETYNRAVLYRQDTLRNFHTRLKAFDEEHKNPYIKKMIGDEPIEPMGLIKVAVPIYLLKKRKYEKELAEYQRKYSLAEKAYSFDYRVEREKLQKTEKKEREDAIAYSDKVCQTANQKYREVSERISENGVIAEKYKRSDIIETLIAYLSDGRADTLKEAINLWHDEERKRIEAEQREAHRAELLRIEEERLRTEQERAEYQRLAYYEAQSIAESAKQAVETAHNIEYSISSTQSND